MGCRVKQTQPISRIPMHDSLSADMLQKMNMQSIAELVCYAAENGSPDTN